MSACIGEGKLSKATRLLLPYFALGKIPRFYAQSISLFKVNREAVTAKIC